MGDSRRRALVAREAARLMYEEGVGEYFTAKRRAARRVLGRDARGARFRPGDLPSNGEIRDALRALATFAEGRRRWDRLFAMRATALRLMRILEPWHPRLIGSVWSGHARRGSDIDLHVFVDSIESLELALDRRGRRFERTEVLIHVGDTFRTYTHIHLLDEPFPVELSVHLPHERRVATRSSTDGERIDRVTAARLEALLRAEHPERAAAWDGGPVRFVEDAPAGAFAGLLAELSGD